MDRNVERLREYLEQATAGVSWRTVAQRIGIDQSTVSRHLSRGHMPVETVVAIARAYGADLLDGIVLAGLVTREEAGEFTARRALEHATDLQIAEENLRRVRAAPRPDLGSHPASVRRERGDAWDGPAFDAAALVRPVAIDAETAEAERQP